MQTKAAQHGIEAAPSERQALFVSRQCKTIARGPRRHLGRKIQLHQPLNATALLQRSRHHAIMATKIESGRESPSDVVQPIRKPFRYLSKEEIVGAEIGGGAVAMPAQRTPVERRGFVTHYGTASPRGSLLTPQTTPRPLLRGSG